MIWGGSKGMENAKGVLGQNGDGDEGGKLL